MTVVLVEAETAPDNSLANQIVAIGEAPDNCTALQFIDNLRIAGGIIGVDKIVGGQATGSFRYAIAITVVDITHAAAIERGQTVIEVVGVILTACGDGVAVIVIALARQPIISVV